jgi:2-polyprenyl-6-hydroxyphenyl methylase/3-demethylubiquinone-9 3-methyltransferase
LPFRDASFDLVYCCDVLEHVDDLERVMAESARVRPSG